MISPKSSKKKTSILVILLIAIAIVAVCIFTVFRKGSVSDYSEKYAGADIGTDAEGELGRDDTYAKYLASNKDAALPDKTIVVVSEAVSDEADTLVRWEFDVAEAGMYRIHLEYFALKSRGVDIERKLYINGKVPFAGADSLNFSRNWTDKTEVKRDNQGNDIRPPQTDEPDWIGAYIKDDMGYYTEPYSFYFDKGTNTIALETVNEPMIIRSLKLVPVVGHKTYAEYVASLPDTEQNESSRNYKQVIQGEDSVLRSSPSLYATYDRSSPATVPYSVSEIRLNMIGGSAWRVPGQWIEWVFEVPKDGRYNITLKARQNYTRGFVSVRTLYIDGEIPFEEAKDIGFAYSNEWNNLIISSGDEPCGFYMEQGTHTLRLEVALGDLGEILSRIQDSIYRLNEMYRKILVLTGTVPDQYRDYRIDSVYPEVIAAMDLESKRLYKITDDIVAYTGERGSQAAIILTLAEQLERFVKSPDKIPKSFVNFKDNISAVGTTVMIMSELPLDIDYITITGTNAEPDKVNETFFAKAMHEVRSFITSFSEDYNSVGDIYGQEDAVEVWILTGRDQRTILKAMIDDTFTPQTDIKVNVKLVEAGTLLNAVIAGTGPDVVLTVGQAEPVNYAIRNAVEDLTQFADCGDILEGFYPSAYAAYWFEGGLYALPETQNYNVLFYRKDILEELGLAVPQTWDDVIDALPVIQQNNMNIAIPSTERVAGADLSGFFSLLYQNGGTVYDINGDKTLIDNEFGVMAFETYTKFFTQYGVPTLYDFPNRFRSGEMPLGIQDYGTFNTLVVFAPEIRGLWDFTLVPGKLMPDGTIDRSCQTNGACSMLLAQSDETLKQNAWAFMKWWAGADAQTRFGQEMESVMGAAARYATANTEAFARLSWSAEQMKILSEQRAWTVGIPEVAGGYYTGRHITNAVRNVINNNADCRETLLDYARTINEEVDKKRLEFGLSVR
jgi:ABC-type glycerol-3-phosphate transport system substrate-binding protein